MSARRCEKRLGIDSVHQLHGHILPFLGEQVCVAAAVCREWRQATLALPEQFWKLTALRLWPGITDMDALTQYASYRELVLDRNRSRHWTNRDVIVPFAAEILATPGVTAESLAFSCAGMTWCLRLCWCEDRDAVSVFLCMLGAEGDDDTSGVEYTLPVRAEITLKNRQSSNADRCKILCQTFSTRSASWGWRSFIPADFFRNPMLGYVGDNQVHITVKLQWWIVDAVCKLKLGPFREIDWPQIDQPISLVELSRRISQYPHLDWDAREMYNALVQHYLNHGDWEILCTSDLARLTKEEHEFVASMSRRIRFPKDVDPTTVRSRLIRCLVANGFSFKRTLQYLRVKRNFGVYCDGCGAHNFPGERRNCLQCRNYDLCGDCYRSEVETCQHKKGHSMSVLEPSVWLDV